jgi:exopolyphosphatase
MSLRASSVSFGSQLGIVLIIILSSHSSRGLFRLANAYQYASFLGRFQTQALPLRGLFSSTQPGEESGASTTAATIMNVNNSNMKSNTCQSLNDFLKMLKENPSKHYVVGNEAGDADSIISSIALAYIESDVDKHKAPLVSIPRADLTSQRPETVLLLELAGVSQHAVSQLIFVDDPLIADGDNDVDAVTVTLVDHNRLKETFQQKHWKVLEIVDHHYDEKDHTDSCSGTARQIAFCDDTSKALVASTCTLVAERLKAIWDPHTSYPVSIGVLLLGVILLDSVNMLPAAGKGTPRDSAAIQTLLDKTNWQDLSPRAAELLKVSSSSSSSGKPDTQAFFDSLQNAKFDPSFWKSLSVRDALRLDYKRFSTENSGKSFGVATVLLPMNDFLVKPNVVESLQEYMQQADVDFLGVMLTYTDSTGGLGRQMVLCGRNSFPLDGIVQFLKEEGTLSLQEVDDTVTASSSCVAVTGENGFALRLFNQGNARASRKQVAPILLQFFESGASTVVENESKI